MKYLMLLLMVLFAVSACESEDEFASIGLGNQQASGSRSDLRKRGQKEAAKKK